MFDGQARTYDELCAAEGWPLSRLYHQHSKLSEHKRLAFLEAIAAHSCDVETLRAATRAYKPYPTRREIDLPRARRRLGGRRLYHLLRSRRTRRGQFSPRPVSLQQWGTLLEMACGLTGRIVHPEFPDVVQELRAWPSGGALYPIEVYLAALASDQLERAWYHYQVPSHRLAEIGPCPDQTRLERLVFAEDLWTDASGLLVLTGLFARTQSKYGERGYRFVLLDAGHLAQNILLACEDLGLAAVPLGGFEDDGLAGCLELDIDQEAPLYAILIGTTSR